ncbi:hypothetical protein ACO0K3_14470 [Undibacterium sp. Rencai35W]|uniref:hypothetical protein n=1 Tax=Undibacterium sp. Rencai35W TaxID=3413046 RepID=UPI003BF19F67
MLLNTIEYEAGTWEISNGGCLSRITLSADAVLSGNSDADSDLPENIVQARRVYKDLKSGHLLNANFLGPGNDARNMTILSSSGNSAHLKQFEDPLRNFLLKIQSIFTDKRFKNLEIRNEDSGFPELTRRRGENSFLNLDLFKQVSFETTITVERSSEHYELDGGGQIPEYLTCSASTEVRWPEQSSSMHKTENLKDFVGYITEKRDAFSDWRKRIQKEIEGKEKNKKNKESDSFWRDSASGIQNWENLLYELNIAQSLWKDISTDTEDNICIKVTIANAERIATGLVTNDEGMMSTSNGKESKKRKNESFGSKQNKISTVEQDMPEEDIV